jgi:predicted restriction endonuclease
LRKTLPHLFEREEGRIRIGNPALHLRHLFIAEAQPTIVLRSDAAGVLRRLQETQAQIRRAQNVRELKALYRNTCMFCGKQTIIGVNPSKFYSEASHIKPVGQPHNGPDRKDNMLLLCPEHHLQFDYGVLSVTRRPGGLRIVSKIPGDLLNGSALRLQAPHTIDDEYVSWHCRFWRS